MPTTKGYRRGTRSKFSRDFRRHGPVPLSVYMTQYKLGQYVDIKVNASIVKGMPHRSYHGTTGQIYNITQRSIGVRINKQVNGRIVTKYIIARVEHIKPSRCREQFEKEQKEYLERLKNKKPGEIVRRKKPVGLPREAFEFNPKEAEIIDVEALPFIDLI